MYHLPHLADPLPPILQAEKVGTFKANMSGDAGLVTGGRSHRRPPGILLTTHSMHEADALSDVVAIMSHGRLCAIGTQLELKRKYGEGAKLTITLALDAAAPTPDAAADRTDAFLRSVVSPHVRLVSRVGLTVAYSLPRHQHSEAGSGGGGSSSSSDGVDFAALFDALQNRKGEAGLAEWGITQTSLDDVFIAVIERNAEARGYAT